MRKNLIWALSSLGALALIVGLAWAIASEEPIDPSVGHGTPEVTGQALTPVPDPAQSDPMVGSTAPEVLGADWDGNEVRIEADGRPKIIVFLAHWCPHCQAEVPLTIDWLASDGLPEGVDIYGVTVFTSAQRANFPPQAWLVREGWEVPTLLDDATDSVAAAFGVSGTPYYVVLGPDHRVLGRLSGSIGRPGLDALAALAANSATSP